MSSSKTSSTPVATSPASDAGLTQSAKIGVGVGVSFGALLVALLSLIAFRLYKNSEANAPRYENDPAKHLVEPILTERMTERHELTAAEHPKEMYTAYNSHEIEGT